MRLSIKGTEEPLPAGFRQISVTGRVERVKDSRVERDSVLVGMLGRGLIKENAAAVRVVSVDIFEAFSVSSVENSQLEGGD